MTYYRKDSASAHILSEEFDFSVLRTVRVLHLSGISLGISMQAQKFGISLMKAARQAGARISLDLNYRPALWDPAEAFCSLNLLSGNTWIFLK
jgi:2-dehydro-3-deoxygluconokinase